MKKRNEKKVKVVSDLGYIIFRPIIRFYGIIALHPKFLDKHNIPKKGGVILAGTHVSDYDFLLVGSGTLRPMHFLCKKELTDIKGLRWFFRFVGLIRVDRSKSNPQAKEEAVEALKMGKVVCVFPEGTINRTDDIIMPFKPGAIRFAMDSGCPIVPFAISGRPKSFKYGTKVKYGKPYYVKSKDLDKEIKILENKVIKLLKEVNNE